MVKATHEYRFTPTLVFQYNSERRVVRVVDNGVEGEWFSPSIRIDFRRFVVLPLREPDSATVKRKAELLLRLRNPIKFLKVWRERLKNDDDYTDLLEDLRQIMIYAQLLFRKHQVDGQFADGTGDQMLAAMLASIEIDPT